jgi:hypothetical protein
MITMSKNNQLAEIKEDDIKALDKITKEAMVIGTIGERFENAFKIAYGIEKLEKALTPNVMKPVMKLQGSRLGFRTDKDKDGGYPQETVKRCMIEAVMKGIYPCFNQFNIIAHNMYITQEGYRHLLDNINDLKYSIVPEVPEIKEKNKTYSANVKIRVSWQVGIDGKALTQSLEFNIKGATNSKGYHITSNDAYIGKAKRKAMHWLHEQVTGITSAEGDASEIDITPKKEEKPKKQIEESNEEPPELFTEPVKEGEVTLEEKSALYKEISKGATGKHIKGYLVKEGHITPKQSFKDISDELYGKIKDHSSQFIDSVNLEMEEI